MLLKGQTVKYRGTQTGMRISAVDGTAFIDGATSGVTDLADGNHSIEIYDSAGRMLKGVLKAAGTGETYTDIIGGTDPALLNGDFSSGDTIWQKETGWTIVDQGGGDYEAVATAADTTYSIVGPSTTIGAIYKLINSVTSLSSGGFLPQIGGINGTILQSSVTTYTNFITAITTGTLRIQAWGTTTGRIDDVVLQKVLTPSSSGATIVSAKAGETYNFAYKNASFAYNAASYYCIIKAIK